jgi:general stress protein 26
MPGYGILDAASGSGLLPWSWLSERMASSRNYWVASARPDGRPHVMPVWGVWVDDVFYFGTGRRSRKARNLEANPSVVVHLESGDEVVILEGVLEEVREAMALDRYAEAYDAKYAFRPDTADPDSLTLALLPTKAFGWIEQDYPGSATRWQFDAPGEASADG